MAGEKKLTTRTGAPLVDNQKVVRAGPRGLLLLGDVWFMENLDYFSQ